jgi:NAD-dependent deacetylase
MIRKAAEALSGARRAIALTGAGISVESGIPPFRGPGGLWEKIDPFQYAHIDAFRRDPEKVWRVLFMDLKSVIEKARPNAAHKGLYELEQMGILKTVITQNIDGLHQQAGNRDVIEFHGTFAVQRCMICNGRHDPKNLDFEQVPPRCACGGFLRPDVVLFGEVIPGVSLQRSQVLAATCDLILVVGASATVEPAAYLPVIAKRSGATVIEINAEPTALTHQISDLSLFGQATEIMDQIVAKL